MTQLQIIARMEPGSTASDRAACDPLGCEPIESQAPIWPHTTGVHLKCPDCQHETVRAHPLALDAVRKCIACGSKSEFRELHEAWCLSRRPILARAFPELAWLAVGEIKPV